MVGTSSDDFIGATNNATATQFNTVDTIDGGAGTDTLSLDLNAAYAGGATIKNVEKVNVTSTNGAFNAVGITGMTNFNVNAGAAAAVTNLGNVLNLGVSNVANLVEAFTFTDAAVAGTTDAVTVTLNNVTAGAGNTDLDIMSATALAAGVETLNIVSSGVANAVRLGSNDATITTLNVSGDQNLTLTLGTAANAAQTTTSVTTVNASTMTGGLTIAGMGVANQTITGGSGNDTFNFGANFAAGDSVVGGAGTDTLSVTLALTAAQWALTSGLEAVRWTMGAAVTQDASLLTGVNTFTTSGAFAQTLSNLSNNANTTVAAATTTLTETLQTATGLSDALTVQMNPSTGATASFTLGTLTNVVGLEQLNVVANGSSNAIVNTITTDAVTAKHVVTGAGSLTITNAIATTQFDASGLTGNLTVTAVAGGSNIQGGSGADVITGGAGADTIVGNAGNDQIAGAAGNDVMQGGAGADQFTVGATTTSTASSANTLSATIANGNTITFGNGVDVVLDFVSGTDTINVTAAATAPTSLMGWTSTTALVNGTTYSLVGTYNSSTGVFTVNNAATASTANVATLIVEGNGITTDVNNTGSTILVGVASLVAADFV